MVIYVVTEGKFCVEILFQPVNCPYLKQHIGSQNLKLLNLLIRRYDFNLTKKLTT